MIHIVHTAFDWSLHLKFDWAWKVITYIQTFLFFLPCYNCYTNDSWHPKYLSTWHYLTLVDNWHFSFFQSVTITRILLECLKKINKRKSLHYLWQRWKKTSLRHCCFSMATVSARHAQSYSVKNIGRNDDSDNCTTRASTAFRLASSIPSIHSAETWAGKKYCIH